MSLLTLLNTSGDVFRDEFSLAFDGSNDYVVIDGFASSDVLSEDDAFTIVFWAKSTSGDRGATSDVVFGVNGISGTDRGNVVRIGFNPNSTGGNPEGGIFYADSRTGNVIINDSATYTGGTSFNDGQWHHIVITRASGAGFQTTNVYVDTVKQSYAWDNDDNSAYNSGQLQSDPIWGNGELATIGAEWDNGPAIGDYFLGSISELAIYNTAFSLNSIQQIYNGREPYNHNEGIVQWALKAWWRMGDGRFDQKNKTDLEGGIVCDETDVGLGSDLLGGKGDFSDPSYWLITTDESIVEDNVGKWLGAGSYGQIRKDGILTSGKMYKVVLDVTAHSSSTTGHSIALNFTDPYTRLSDGGAVGTFTTFFKAYTVDFKLYQSADYDIVATIDNVTCQEVTGGNHGEMLNMQPDDFTGDTP